MTETTWTLRGINRKTRDHLTAAAKIKGMSVGRLANKVLLAAALEIRHLEPEPDEAAEPGLEEATRDALSRLSMRLKAVEERLGQLQHARPPAAPPGAGPQPDHPNALMIRLLWTVRGQDQQQFRNMVNMLMAASSRTKDPLVRDEMMAVMAVVNSGESLASAFHAGRRHDTPLRDEDAPGEGPVR